MLNIATISKADDWLDTVLPRFVAYVRAHCSGPRRLHLLLLTTDDDETATAAAIARAAALFDEVVCEPFHDATPQQRLLVFDELRASLPTTFGVPELLYIDPDTDVVADLQGIQSLSPNAELLWAANPFPLRPVLEDLARHGFSRSGEEGILPCVEPGFLYLRRDLSWHFAALKEQFPDVHRFAPGSTYWTMLAQTLGSQAVRLPDDYNRTFWDVSGAASTARSVHYTGQWKRLQPFVEYRRERRELVIHAQPQPLPQQARRQQGQPAAET